MKNVRYTVLSALLVVVFLFLENTPARGQIMEAFCKEQVRQIYDRLNNAPALPPEASDRVFHLHYSVRVTPRDSIETGISESDIEVYIGRRQVRMISDKMHFYQDEQKTITVIPVRDLIVEAESNLGQRMKNPVQFHTGLQDSLFSMSWVEDCIPTEQYGATRKVILQLTERGQERFNFSTVTVYANMKTQSIEKVHIDYVPGHKLAEASIRFHRVSYDYQTTILQTPIEAAVYDDDGNLLPGYEDFKVIRVGDREQPGIAN